MVEFDKIEDLDQLKAWLETLDLRISRAIAARSAMRALPALMDVVDETFNKTPGASLLLSGLRATLISGGASTCPHTDMNRLQAAALSAADSADSAAHSAALSAALSAAHSAHSAARSADSAADFARSAVSAVSAAHSAARSADSAADSAARSAARSATFTDADRGRDGDPHQIFAAPLWPNGDDVAHLLKMWSDFEVQPDPDGTWNFWRTWYRGMLIGEPIDWDLQLQVALIDDKIWEAGPKAVAKGIERIRAKFELEQEVRRLKEQLVTQEQDNASPQIGDNGGPPLDALPAKAFKKDILLLWEDIDELEAEITKPEPSPAVLKRVAQSLSEIALRIAAYCSTTMDVSVKAAAKTFGATLGSIGATEIVKPGSIEAVAKAIGKFLTALAN